MSQWMVSGKKCDFKHIGESLGVDQVIVRIMRNRDLIDEEQMRRFLYGKNDLIHSYESLKDVDRAVDILLDKIDEGVKIRIIGDYDVDGIMSTYILWRGLTVCGASVDTVIPHRIKDGYGINDSLIDDAANEGIDTIITCDNGIAAREACDHALEYGITCIITDHHEIPFDISEGVKRYVLPNAPAVVDPKQEDCSYPYKNICGAVVALKVMEALFDALGEDEEKLDELRELAGFATVCDVMELRDENRVYVKNTLESLKRSRNIGMRALVKVCGLEGKNISSHSIGFVLGPCINATGRLDSADLSLQLLQSKTIEDAILMADRLKQLNESRKTLTEQGTAMALEIIKKEHIDEDKVMVIYVPGLHESLAGIVAGRIREKYSKPVFIVSDAEEGLKGSARSIPAYHIYEAMTEVKDIFDKYGGHAMAAGFSLQKDRLTEFITRINDNCKLTQADYEERIVIDVPMPLDYVTMELIDQLELLEPWGPGNEKPVFAQKDIEFVSYKMIGKNNDMARFKAKTPSGRGVELLLFRNTDVFFERMDSKYGEGTAKRLKDGAVQNVLMDIIYYPSVNEYQGSRSIQFIINDFR